MHVTCAHRHKTGLIWGLMASGLMLLIGSTCPQQGNQPPDANAGPDQTVATGAAVTLNGTGSSDPDGDTLSFSWTQTSGTAVVLNGANTANATFTAPNASTNLTFQLSVDDGRGGTDVDTVTITVGGGTTLTPRLFIASFTGNNVISYANPQTVNGNIAPDTNLAGAQTQLNAPADIVVNSANQLLVANFNGDSITTYNNASASNGNLAPDGNVQGAATQLIDPTTLAINTAQDLLFVADITTDDITVYENTSATTFNGNLAPVRTIQSAALNNPTGINFGANDDLYVANSGGFNILVFANASNLNGVVDPTRILTNAAFTTLFDVFVDDNDNLFAVLTNGQVLTFNNASTLNGAVAPSFTLTVPAAVTLSAIVVDRNDVGYIVDFGANAVYSYNAISTRNGALAPNRTIQGANTQLISPIRVFLSE